MMSSDGSLAAHVTSVDVTDVTFGSSASATLQFKGHYHRQNATYECVLSDNHQVLGGQTDSVTCTVIDASPPVVVVDHRVIQGDVSITAFFNAEQWASLVSMGTGDTETMSNLSRAGMDHVSSVVLSDSSIICQSQKQGQVSMQPLEQ